MVIVVILEKTIMLNKTSEVSSRLEKLENEKQTKSKKRQEKRNN